MVDASRWPYQAAPLAFGAKRMRIKKRLGNHSPFVAIAARSGTASALSAQRVSPRLLLCLMPLTPLAMLVAELDLERHDATAARVGAKVRRHDEERNKKRAADGPKPQHRRRKQGTNDTKVAILDDAARGSARPFRPMKKPAQMNGFSML